MPVNASENVQQPLVGFKSGNNAIQIANGYIVLDLSQFQNANPPGTWLADDILWSVHIDTATWEKEITASLLVFPMTWDVTTETANSRSLGWGIDSWGFDPPNDLRSTSVDLKARLVLKSTAAEVLRVGYQLTLSMGKD